MKTSKLILITVVMFFASIGFSNTESIKVLSEQTTDNTIIKINILKALKTPGLNDAIRQQVSSKFLLLNINSHEQYKFLVKWHSTEYLVIGYRYEWLYFFTEDIYIIGH